MEINITMQQLKQQRATPAEKFVLDKIKGAKPNEQDEVGGVYWNKDGKWIFEQCFKHGYLLIDNNSIRFVLEKEYGLNNYEIGQLLTKLLHKYTNNGQLKIKF